MPSLPVQQRDGAAARSPSAAPRRSPRRLVAKPPCDAIHGATRPDSFEVHTDGPVARHGEQGPFTGPGKIGRARVRPTQAYRGHRTRRSALRGRCPRRKPGSPAVVRSPHVDPERSPARRRSRPVRACLEGNSRRPQAPEGARRSLEHGRAACTAAPNAGPAPRLDRLPDLDHGAARTGWPCEECNVDRKAHAPRVDGGASRNQKRAVCGDRGQARQSQEALGERLGHPCGKLPAACLDGQRSSESKPPHFKLRARPPENDRGRAKHLSGPRARAGVARKIQTRAWECRGESQGHVKGQHQETRQLQLG